MKLEDFGFTPIHGQKYVVNFTSDGELISTSTYNGTALPEASYPDNSVINMTVTDKDTGKTVMTSEYISYNGKLYKSIFNLPLANKESNMNADTKLHDLHYDLTTGSVLVKVQGYAGEKYKLTIADTSVKSKAASMDITLKEGTFYSIPTVLVQGNEFEITLSDKHNKDLSSQTFTAPIDTNWRSTSTVAGSEVDNTSDEESEDDGDTNSVNLDMSKEKDTTGETQYNPEGQSPNTETTSMSLLSMDGQVMGIDKPVAISGFFALVIVAIILAVLRSKIKKKARVNKINEEHDINRNEQSASGDEDGDGSEYYGHRLEEGRTPFEPDVESDAEALDDDNNYFDEIDETVDTKSESNEDDLDSLLGDDLSDADEIPKPKKKKGGLFGKK